MKNIVFTFEELGSDKASKKLSQVFAKAGANVVQATPGAKVQRTAGVTYRTLDLTFADGQTVTLMVKQTGDIYQVKLNGAVLPIKNQDDHKAAVTEIIKAMESGRAKFQAKQAKTRAELPTGTKSVAPKIEATLKARITELDAEIATKQEKVKELQAELDAPVLDSAWGDDPDNDEGAEPDNDPDDANYEPDDSQASLFDSTTNVGDTYVQVSYGNTRRNYSPQGFAKMSDFSGDANDAGSLLKAVNDWNALHAISGSPNRAIMITLGAGSTMPILDSAGKCCDSCGKSLDKAGKCMDCGGKVMDKACCDKCGMDSADCECEGEGEDKPFKREWSMA